MNVARILYPVEVLGPGRRVGIWVCGCRRGCKGCSNPELREQRPEYEVKIEEIAELIGRIGERYEIDGFTVSGGEPMDQAVELAKLMEELRRYSEDILIYTGYRIEELQERSDAAAVLAQASGCYTYIEGHYCLDDDSYIDFRDRQYRRLNAYARHHIEECCISFSVRGRYASTEYADAQAARKKEVKDKYQSRHDLDAEPETKERVLQNKRFTDDAEIWMKLKMNMPDTFRQAIQDIIDLKGISQNELAMRMGVSRAAPRKWCAGKPSLRHVVALCIAMDVRADIGEELVRLAGISFQNNLEHNILRSMLYETRDLTVARANEIMRQNKLLPLTNGADEEIACWHKNY